MRSKSEGSVRTFTGVGALAAALLLLGAVPAGAQPAPVSPVQPFHYVPGIAGIRDFATPPPGLFAVWYNWVFSSNTFKDRNGDPVRSVLQGNVAVDLDVTVWSTAPVLAFSSRRTVLGGARYLAAVAPSFFVADGTFIAQGEGIVTGTPSTRIFEGNLSGFSDLIVVPLGLSWAFGKFKEGTPDPRDPMAGMTDEEIFAEYGLPPRRRFNASFFYWFAAPTGRYEPGAADNLGLGFWTHVFQGFGYFYPWNHQALAFEAGLTFETNSKIKGSDVRPGNRLSLEYGMSLWPTGWLELGLGGAHNWQISDDTGADVFWDPSVHDRKNMVFFSAGFMPVFPRFLIETKYGIDYGARQRLDGVNFVLNFYFITGLLDGR